MRALLAWLWFVAPPLVAAWYFADEALQVMRAKRVDTPAFGIVRQANRPRLFRFIMIVRWVLVAMFGTVGLALFALLGWHWLHHPL